MNCIFGMKKYRFLKHYSSFFKDVFLYNLFWDQKIAFSMPPSKTKKIACGANNYFIFFYKIFPDYSYLSYLYKPKNKHFKSQKGLILKILYTSCVIFRHNYIFRIIKFCCLSIHLDPLYAYQTNNIQYFAYQILHIPRYTTACFRFKFQLKPNVKL